MGEPDGYFPGFPSLLLGRSDSGMLKGGKIGLELRFLLPVGTQIFEYTYCREPFPGYGAYSEPLRYRFERCVWGSASRRRTLGGNEAFTNTCTF